MILIFITHIYLCFCFCFLPLASPHTSVRDQKNILIQLKKQLGDPPSLQHWTENSLSPCDDWPEINCIDSTVTEVVLREKNLTGKIQPGICRLQNLTLLDVASNHIYGKFPTHLLHNCRKLKFLRLYDNAFVGAIPNEIDRLSWLSYLDLSRNNFSGEIPATIAGMKELRTLYLDSNSLNGSVPWEAIGNLSALENLALAGNAGLAPSHIPESLGQLRNMKGLWLYGMNLMGRIPQSFTNFTDIEILDLSSNDLVGTIPHGLLKLTKLNLLYLWSNALSGEIPSVIEAFDIIELDLSDNNLSGSIPRALENLPKLEILRLNINNLSGEVPNGIGLLPELKVLKLFTNRLSGVLPPSLGLSSRIEFLDVSTNQLSSQLPKGLCGGGVLVALIVFSNKLSGQIPAALERCNTLEVIQLDNNRFAGQVPLGLWTLSQLVELNLSNNSLSGELPPRVAKNLKRLEISNNRFSGNVPLGVSTWESLIVMSASHNLLSGEIPMELTSLRNLTTLELDDNRLIGHLPSEVISWQSLTSLNLSRNALSGPIPTVFGSLPDLVYLDLSENELSGEIPLGFGHTRYNVLNLSSNNFSGEVPSGFNNSVYQSSFLNNPGLCCDDHDVLSLPSCSPETSHNKSSPSSSSSSSSLSSSKRRIVIAVFAIAAAHLVIVLVILFISRTKHMVASSAEWQLTSFQRLNFTLESIVSGLTDENLIGAGGSGKVYRITVNDNSKEFVAAKVILEGKNLDVRLKRQFEAEIEVLGRIRHSNVVKLLCCISSKSSMVLVYEYLENHSVDQWIYGKNKSLNGLDWPKRMHIATGVAQGLSYIHHDCTPPIIHRDVKSANILLDSEFKPKIADFGLAKMSAKPGELNTMTAVQGSIGYLPPEYSYTTRIDEKVDVYGFGVVLLELMTGREAIVQDGEEIMNLADWASHYFQQGNPIGDALDKEMIGSGCLEDMISVFKLGLICTSRKPSSRPSMAHVVRSLRSCSFGWTRQNWNPKLAKYLKDV